MEEIQGLKMAVYELKDDSEYVKKVLEQYPHDYKYISTRLKMDRKLFIKTMKQCTHIIKYALDFIKNDKKIIRYVICIDGMLFKCASKELMDDNELALLSIKNNHNIFSYLHNKHKDNYEIANIAVKKNGLLIKYASNNLRQNKKLIYEAVKQNGYAINYCIKSEEYDCFDDKELALLGLETKGLTLENISERLRNDYDIGFKAIKKHAYVSKSLISIKLFENDEIFMMALKTGNAYLPVNTGEINQNMLKLIIKYQPILLSKKFRNDKKLMNKAIEKNERCVEYAGDELRDDEDFVFQHMNKIIHNKNINAVHWISKRLLNTPKMLIKLMNYNNCILINKKVDKTNDVVFGDRDVALCAIKWDGFLLRYFNHDIFDDYEIILCALNNTKSKSLYDKDKIIFIKKISKRLLNLREILIAIIENLGCGLQFAKKKYRYDYEICIKSLLHNKKIRGLKHAFLYIDPKLRYNDEKIISLAIEKDEINLKYCSRFYRQNTEFLHDKIIEKNSLFQYCGLNIRNNKEIIDKVMKQNLNIYIYIGNSLKKNDDDVYKLVDMYPHILHYVKNKSIRMNESFMLKLVSEDKSLYHYIDKKFKNDIKFMSLLSETNDHYFMHCYVSILSNKAKEILFLTEYLKQCEKWNNKLQAIMHSSTGALTTKLHNIKEHVDKYRSVMESYRVKMCDKCSICYDYINGDNEIYLTVCGHKFHEKCANTWFNNHNKCPLCNAEN
jgi:hypothetical protein